MFSNQINKFENVDYLILDSNEMDDDSGYNRERRNSNENNTNQDGGEDEFSTYFTDKRVEIPQDDRVSSICIMLFIRTA